MPRLAVLAIAMLLIICKLDVSVMEFLPLI
jgi:hypothetical protein